MDRLWHDRGYLPHFEGPDAIQHVTFHLADSLPAHILAELDQELSQLPHDEQKPERRRKIDALIDAGYGGCILREPEIAQLMQTAFLRFHSERYELLAWVVMPNHIHVLIKPLQTWTTATIVASSKKFTARKFRQHRPSTQPVWHREYWDRYIRTETHLQRVIAYIHDNPVKAGLVSTAEHWPWSSVFSGNAAISQSGDWRSHVLPLSTYA